MRRCGGRRAQAGFECERGAVRARCPQHHAPRPFAGWAEARRQILAALPCAADRVVMVGDTAEERDWAQAARLAWYLPADRYFAA